MSKILGKKAILFEKLSEGKVKCTACPHQCVIAEGNTGICGVRKNYNGKLYLTVYERPCTVHIDPIEKKPLFHFMPGTRILSIGTIGCNLRCDFCQNWDISQATKLAREQLKDKEKTDQALEELIQSFPKYSPKELVQECVEKEIPSIAFTYNEPTIFFEYAYDIAKEAHKKDIKTVFVSNGYMSQEALDIIAPYLDADNVDLKSFRDEYYKEICGAKLQPVLDTIQRLKEHNIWTEITTLVIPGKNDSDKELTEIAEFIASVGKEIPWHISAFTPQYKMMNVKHTPHETLVRAYAIGKKAGLKYVYVGNVRDEEKENTNCAKCGYRLVKRDWFNVLENNILDGKCPKCGTEIEGVWK